MLAASDPRKCQEHPTICMRCCNPTNQQNRLSGSAVIAGRWRLPNRTVLTPFSAASVTQKRLQTPLGKFLLPLLPLSSWYFAMRHPLWMERLMGKCILDNDFSSKPGLRSPKDSTKEALPQHCCLSIARDWSSTVAHQGVFSRCLKVVFVGQLFFHFILPPNQ